jgi:S1-C subfamily serine protease
MTFKAIRILLSALLFHSQYAMMPVKTAKKALAVSVLLHMKSAKKEGRRSYSECSGTYVAPTLILTAAHCFVGEDQEYVWARGIDDSVGYPVHVVRLNGYMDLALLEAPYAHPYARLGPMPSQGDGVLNVGSPFNFEFVVSEGVVGMVGMRIRGYISHYLVTTAMINPGSSGGGAFDNKGRLIGVNTMLVGFLGWSGISLAVSVDDVRVFLADIV